jgi:hypothetical protein
MMLGATPCNASMLHHVHVGIQRILSTKILPDAGLDTREKSFIGMRAA